MESNTNLSSQLAQCLNQAGQIREELIEMLSELSAKALVYVCRPIHLIRQGFTLQRKEARQ